METSPLIVDIEPSPTRYATFTGRFRALVIDSGVVLGVIMFVVIVGDILDRVPGTGRLAWATMFAAIFLYEPLFVWRRGATIGHAMNGLVVSDRSGGRPSLLQAYARYVAKLIVGIPSFLTMAMTRKHQAVHDILTRTTVRLADDAEPGVYDFNLERTEESEQLLPSRVRRSVVMVVYLVAGFVGYVIVLSVLAQAACLQDHSCTGTARAIVDGITLLYLGLAMGTVVAAWRGMLPGARRRQAP